MRDWRRKNAPPSFYPPPLRGCPQGHADSASLHRVPPGRRIAPPSRHGADAPSLRSTSLRFPLTARDTFSSFGLRSILLARKNADNPRQTAFGTLFARKTVDNPREVIESPLLRAWGGLSRGCPEGPGAATSLSGRFPLLPPTLEPWVRSTKRHSTSLPAPGPSGLHPLLVIILHLRSQWERCDVGEWRVNVYFCKNQRI